MTWELAIENLKQMTKTASKEQLKIANTGNIELEATVPFIVASARLRTGLHKILGLPLSQPPHKGQLEFLLALTPEKINEPKEWVSHEEIDAWIQYYFYLKRSAALKILKLQPGDLVRRQGAREEDVDEVSSVGLDGTIWFCGRGSRAWPDTLELVHRANSQSIEAKQAHRMAANRAASRATPGWSLTRQRELEEFQAKSKITQSEIDRLRRVIENAVDERPIQSYLDDHPHILGTLLRGDERYCISQKRLGDQFVTDFLIADVDSTGIRWVFVELESPISGITQRTKNQFDQYARGGIAQVEEWREWIQNNLDYAKRSRRESGLGLFDIRPQDDGVVLVGRRSLINPRSVSMRRILWETKRIHIHTYDWLIERLEFLSTYIGVPAMNPFLLERQNETQLFIENHFSSLA
jgi:Domain of unknown function (DUF4263)